jgi:acyl-CoA synthetase (NDP forming)/GNAT superfamily N-acetyltransferase
MLSSAKNSLENFHRDVFLRDGAVLRLRALRAADREGLVALFSRCSPETIRYRFLRMITELSGPMLDTLASADGVGHIALVVTQGEGEQERLIAVGRYFALTERPGTAEVSFLVEDAMQRRGIGTVLLDTLAEIARGQGITRFSADVLADNRVMLSVFRKAGYGLSSNISYGVTHIEFPILRSEIAEARRAAQKAEANRASLQFVFAPKSAAVIGASRNPASVGGGLFRSLLRWGFMGPVYPINPGANSISGVKAYAKIGELPESPDLVFLAVPADQVAGLARECAAAGVHAVCVLSAGFAETGPAGAERQTELLDICRASGMRLVGPNCMGVVNTAGSVRMLGTFVPIEPPEGNIAISSQSGSLGLALMAQAGKLGLGVSTFVSIGNRADVSGNDLLMYWETDEATDVILLYLETFGNPRRFARIARRVSRAKPIVAVKSRRKSFSTDAPESRIAAHVNSDQAADALFKQTGVIRVDTLAEFFSVARLLASQPIPKGDRLCILTNGGGPGVLAVDAAVAANLKIPKLTAETQRQLHEALSRYTSVANPIELDATSGPTEYRAALEILLDDPEIDAFLIIFIPPLATPIRGVADVLSDVLAARPHLQRPVVAVFFDPYTSVISLPISERKAEARPIRSVPVYNFPESAAAALGAAVRYGEWREAPTGSIVEVSIDHERIEQVMAANSESGWLSDAAAAALLAAAGIETTVAAAEGVEILAGITNDPTFGPLVAFGLGGTLSDILDDIAFRVLPLTDRDAVEMIRSTRVYQLLSGSRGSFVCDAPAVESLLLRLSALAETAPRIVEIELHPVVVHPVGEGVSVMNAKIKLSS